MKSSFNADIDLTPMDDECLRCHTATKVRFSGLCASCTEELRRALGSEPNSEADGGSDAFEPALHVTPNAVALKDD